jgi:hypothetical protein
MKNLIYLFGLYIIILASCDPDEPCPTCFEDIVRCKVNGKDWVSNCKSTNPLFGCSSVRCYYYYKTDYDLSISSVNDKDDIRIGMDQSSSDGGAKIGLNTIEKGDFVLNNSNLNGNCILFLDIDTSYNNKFEVITIDTINYIIEGHFQFKAFNNCGDTSTVTNGYFKTKFKF